MINLAKQSRFILEIIRKMEIEDDSILKNYKEFDSAFKTLISFFKRHNNIINDKTTQFVKILLPLQKTMELTPIAIIEIENLLYGQNNNSERLIDRIKSDCAEIEDWLEEVSIANSGVLNDITTKEYLTYSDIDVAHFFFYEPLIKLTGIKSLKVDNQEYRNTHENIFVDGRGYNLFLKWHQNFFDDNRNYIANYSFIIRKMIDDKLIHDIKQSNYLDFLGKHNVNISRLKTLNDCSTDIKKNFYAEFKNAIYDK